MSKNSPKSSDSDHIQNLKLARRTSVAIGAAFCILFAALVGFTSLRPSPLSSIGGTFSLISHTGNTLTEKEFLGRPLLIFFGYTHCLDICPIKLLEISEILRVLGPQAEIGAIFVTVDPERDTPDVIKDYLANFDPRIIGLTGDRAAIESMLRECRNLRQEGYGQKRRLRGRSYYWSPSLLLTANSVSLSLRSSDGGDSSLGKISP